MVESPMLRVRRLLGKEQRRFIKFCLVGASGVPVNLGCTWLALTTFLSGLDEGLAKALAVAFGIVVSIFTNFLLNDIWTWRDRQDGARGFAGRLLRFYLVCALASAIQYGVALGLTLGLGLHVTLAQVVGIAVATALNFVANNLWTFRARPTPAGEPGEVAEGASDPAGQPRPTR